MKKITQNLLWLFSFLLVQSVSSQNWQTEGLSIDNLTTNTSNQQLAIDSNNNNYILIHKTTQTRNFVLKYDGNSWFTLGPYIPDGTSDMTVPRPQSITIDNTDSVYVAYVDPSLTGKVAVKKWDGSAWVYVGSSQGLAVNTTGINNLVLKSFNDLLYLAYDVPSLGLIVQTFDNTNPWNFVGPAFSISNSVGYLDLAINSGGVPYVVYQDVSNNNFTTVKMFDGTNWVLVGNPIPTFGTLQKIDFKSDDTPCIAYYDGSTSGLAVKEFDGTSWVNFGNTPGANINPYNISFFDLTFRIDNINNPYIAYTENSADEIGRVVTLDTNTNDWIQLPATNAPTGTGVMFSSLALDSQDILHYTYLKSQVTKCVVYNATLSTDDIELENAITIYPNPTNSHFSIESNYNINTITIYDIQGKIVQTFKNQIDNYDISGLNSGVYFAKINSAKGEVTKKLLKQQ